MIWTEAIISDQQNTSLQKKGRIKVGYTASNGRITINRIAGARIDGYTSQSYNFDQLNHYVDIKVGNRDFVRVYCNKIQYPKNSGFAEWLSGTSTNNYPTDFSAAYNDGDGNQTIIIKPYAPGIASNLPWGTTYTFTINGGRPLIWNDINALQPDGATQNAFLFDLVLSDGSVWRNITNEPADFSRPKGTVATISNIRPNVAGIHFTSCEGADSIGNGQYRWTFDNGKVIKLNSAWDSHSLDLNGYLGREGESHSDVYNISGYGKVDVKINGNIVSTNCEDYYGNFNYGTGYEIYNIRANRGFTYDGYGPGSDTTVGRITRSRNVKLKFSKNKYTINYDANGGAGAPATQIAFYSDYFVFSSQQPTKRGYIFKRWKDAGGTTWGPGDTSSNKTWRWVDGDYSIRNKTLNLFAEWEPLKYTVSYTGGEGISNVPAVQHAIYGESFQFSTQKPVRSLYDFITWYDSSNEQWPAGYQGKEGTWKWIDGQYGVKNGNLTLYPLWRASKPTQVSIYYSNLTSNSVNLEWSCIGAEINGYILYYKKSADKNWEKINLQNINNYILTNLTPETDYEIKIEAQNPGGNTESSILSVKTLEDQCKIRIKDNGLWKQGKAFYKKGGQWVKVKKIYIKKDGKWIINKNN